MLSLIVKLVEVHFCAYVRYSWIASILFTDVNFTHVQHVKITRQRKSTLRKNDPPHNIFFPTRPLLLQRHLCYGSSNTSFSNTPLKLTVRQQFMKKKLQNRFLTKITTPTNFALIHPIFTFGVHNSYIDLLRTFQCNGAVWT